jgi:DNA-binding MarR family transcriptional regulator
MSRADETRGPSKRRTARSAANDAAPRLVLDTFLPYRLNVLAAVVSDSLSKVYAKRFGISVPEWRVLAALGERPELTGRDVGVSTRMHKTKVSRTMAALEARGLLTRRPGADDRREAYAALTEKGRAVYQELVPMALSFARDLQAVLSPEERAAFERSLAKVFARALHLAEAHVA